MMAEIVKHPTNVKWEVSLSQPVTNLNAPVVAIMVKSKDNDNHEHVYKDMDEVTNDYQENTTVYHMADAVLNSENYTNHHDTLKVIEYKDQSTPDGKLSGTNNGGKLNSITNTPGIVNTLKNHLYDGFRYLLLADADQQTIEAVSDLLYDNQRIMLVPQVDSIDKLQELHDHAVSYGKTKNTFGNTATVVCNVPNYYPAAGAAGFAATNMPADFSHINGQPGFVDCNFSQDDLDRIDSLNGMTIVNSAGDLMMTGGKTLLGNYVDQFVDYQYTVDYLTNRLQKFHNGNKFPTYDDNTIDLMKHTLIDAGGDLQKMGLLRGPIKVDSLDRNHMSTDDINSRLYNGFTVHEELTGAIDNMDNKLDILLD